MKNRTLSTVLFVVILIAAVFISFFAETTGITFGYFIDTNGGAMLITKDGTPISLKSSKNEDFYAVAGIEKGEKILVIHDGVNETYPASTGVKFIIRLGGASPDNIPQTAIISLTGLGWLDPEE